MPVPRLLLVADDPELRTSAGRELSPGYELLHAADFTAAIKQLRDGPPPAVLLIDLGLADSRRSADFLAALVERDFASPRILLSRRFLPEEAPVLSQSCLVHFALACPWGQGELRAAVEAALGLRPYRTSVHSS